MDFKIENDFEDFDEENTSKKKNRSNIISIIIIVIVSILFGLTVFLISNALFGKKEVQPEVPKNTSVSLTDENVEILYNYVTYGVRNTRNDKFIKEQNVDMNSFSNQEKFYYALQFVQVEDFVSTGEVNSQKQKIYTIQGSKIKNYMQRFFGNRITYANNSVITYPFSFRINNQNVGVMTYSPDKDVYETVFTGLEDNIVSEEVVEPYYTKLVQATRNGKDGSLELQEKIIYTESKEENGTYTINIYKDYEHTMLIEKKQNLTKEQLQENPISIDNYQEKAATITYLFKLNSTQYYFDSSKISNE